MGKKLETLRRINQPKARLRDAETHKKRSDIETGQKFFQHPRFSKYHSVPLLVVAFTRKCWEALKFWLPVIVNIDAHLSMSVSLSVSQCTHGHRRPLFWLVMQSLRRTVAWRAKKCLVSRDHYDLLLVYSPISVIRYQWISNDMLLSLANLLTWTLINDGQDINRAPVVEKWRYMFIN